MKLIGSSNALTTYENGKKDLARHRANKRLTALRTIEDRLRAYKFYYGAMITNAALLGLSISWARNVYSLIDIFFDNQDLTAACLQVVAVLLNFIFIIVVNKLALRSRFYSEELKVLEAEDDCLRRAERLARDHPNNLELAGARKRLIAEVRRRRDEDD